MYKRDLALNNLQQLICHKTKSNFQISLIFDRFFAITDYNLKELCLSLMKTEKKPIFESDSHW